jgi:hypothetical protein
MGYHLSYLVKESSLVEVYFGPQGFQFFTDSTEQNAIQAQFVNSEDNTWNKSWLVVAIDTELGDPYIVVADGTDNTVHTAIFTGDIWELISVASSFESFVACVSIINNTSDQKEPVFVPDESTITDINALKTLGTALDTTSNCEEFWQQFINAYIDWLND